MALSTLSIFTAGLFTFASPCILPLAPVYLALLGGASVGGGAAPGPGPGRTARTVVSAIAFSAGLGMVFVALGMAATAVGRALVVHRTLLTQLGGLAVFLFGLKFLGVLQLPWLERQVRPLHASRGAGTPLGALLLGATFGLGWTPCVGPVLGSVLTYTAASTADPLVGAEYLAAYASGIALPLVALAAVAPLALGWVRRLQHWMRPMQFATGAVLAVVGVLLITDSLGAIAPLRGPLPRPADELAAGPAGETASAPAPAVSPAPGPARPAEAVCETGSTKEGACGLPEERASQTGIAAADAAQLAGPAMVEFISSACPICMRMRPVVAAARRDCAGHGVQVQTIEVDRPGGRALARRYGVLGVPTFLFFDAAGHEVARLVGEQPHATLAQSLEVLSGERCAGFRAFPNAG